jgi:hypothetical protein
MADLANALTNIWGSDYVQKNPTRAYKVSYNAEYLAVSAYLNGGARPANPATFSKLGRGLVEAEDVQRGVVPPPDPPPSGQLGIDRATMLATGGKILREDVSAQADALTGLWGEFSNVPARLQLKTSGGDPGPKADGTAQGNSNYREITVQDGDSWQGESAERSELGRNTCSPYYTENKPGSSDATFAIFDEGQRRLVFFSQRYHANLNTGVDTFQTVMQMKQNQPYLANGPVDSAPALEVSVYGGSILLGNFWTIRWTTGLPAREKWIRYAFDVTFSKDPSKGKVQLFVDHDGSGDFLAASKASPVITCQTLANCTSADPAKVSNGARPAGQSLPSHMRIGCYHRASYGPTTVDVDNVQVMG